MFKTDDEGALVGLIIGLAIIVFIVYIIFLLAMVIAGIAAAGGTVYGGGTAIGNYFMSFKENMVDSNRVAA
jgi:hypothetical protein